MTATRLKVLLLTWDFPPAKGGIQIWMFELARRLPAADVRVLAPAVAGGSAFDATSGLHVRRLRGAVFGQVCWLVELVVVTLYQTLTFRPDLIVCGHVVAGPAALIAARVFGVPYAVFTHAFEIRRRRFRRPVTKVLQGAKLVIANSRFTQESVLTHGIPVERVQIVYPGADPPPLENEVQGQTNRDDGPTILAVSRLVDLYKGHDTMIRCLPLIRAKCEGTRYKVVGGGPLRDYLERLAESLGVGHAVTFEGEVTPERLAVLYQTCDVFVQISREARSGGGAEGFGIVCLEASAAGKPVIAGRSGGLPDALSDGVTGVLVDPTDIGEVADAVVKVLTDRALNDRLGQQGKLRVIRQFTWDHMASAARALFQDAVTPGHA